MSLGSVPAMAMGMSEAPHWVDVFLNNFNTSPYFIGLMMLTMNLGSRFLSLEMSKGQEAFFAHPWVRRFLIFVVFFIGCLLYTSPSPRDRQKSRMPSSA